MEERPDRQKLDGGLTEKIDDEIVRARIRRLIETENRDSLWKKFSSNPIINLIVGFLLTGLVGAALTNHYNNKQKELERERAFVDEVSKIRVQKFAEVWEKADLYEAAVEKAQKILNEPTPSIPGVPTSPEIALKQFQEMAGRFIEAFKISQDRRKDFEDVVVKDRFWIDEDSYQQINKYIEATDQYFDVLQRLNNLKTFGVANAATQPDLDQLKTKANGLDETRKSLRIRIRELTKSMLKG